MTTTSALLGGTGEEGIVSMATNTKMRALEAGGQRREMMAGGLHPSQRWSEKGRVNRQGRGPGLWGATPAPQLW